MNDLVGDFVLGIHPVTELSNGNYVVDSPTWNGGIGAVTLVSGGTGLPLVGNSTAVSSSNSLVGSTAGDDVGVGGVTVLSNGNYVVASPRWNSMAGAATLVSGSTGLPLNGTSTVSSANSLVGRPTRFGGPGGGPNNPPHEAVSSGPGGGNPSIPGDQVGFAGVTALSNGAYVVNSPLWNNDTGAATLVSGITGLTVDGGDVVTPVNSLLGDNPGSGLFPVVVDPVNQTFLASFRTDGSNGTIKIGLTTQVPYALDQGQDVTLSPGFLTLTLDTGTAVVLQAGNDITIDDPINVSAGGRGGDLTLQAGRSILLNADVATDNGNLTLIANDTLADGVIDGDRDGGAAVITMAAGTSIDAGSGSVVIDLRDGAGKTNTDGGPVTLGSITAASVTVSSEGPTPNSDIDLAGTITSGSVHLTAAVGSIFTTAAAEIATTGLVTLDASGSIGLAASRIVFDAASSPSSMVVGAADQPTSVYLDGLGNLTLGSISGGTANTTVDVTVRGNLTVAGNATINSGTGTIRLGADLNADESGNDGVGVLSIAAGAVVESTNGTAGAITLRGADMNILGAVTAAGAGGGAAVQTSVKTLPMSFGGSDDVVDGVNLTDAELKRITTTSTGTATFGDSNQTGDLTFVTATTATTPGASTIVQQSTNGPGEIILDQQFLHRAINGNGGSVSLTAGTGGVYVINPDPRISEVVAATAPGNQNGIEGVSSNFSLGSFADEGTDDGPWTVTVNWGDNTPSTTFSAATQGAIASQPHVYAAGTYTVTVAVTNADELTSNTAKFSVTVSDLPVTIDSVPGFLADEGFTTGPEEVAQFSDPGNPTGLVHPLSEYTVKLDWGDGSKPVLVSPASITYIGEDGNGNGLFSVTASHTYQTGGLFTIQTSVTDGSSTTVGPVQTTIATVAASTDPTTPASKIAFTSRRRA